MRHGLLFEGAPFDEDGRRAFRLYGGASGPGCAKCACGAMSEPLSSGAARKRWHRAHKAEVVLLGEQDGDLQDKEAQR